MRNTRNRRHLPLHLEPFEARQLLSASVAQTYTSLVTNSSPAVVASDQSDTGTTIQAATNQSFGGYLGTFHNLNIPNAPASAFYVSNSILHIVNPAFPDTTDQTLDSYNVNINWGDGATVTHDAYLVPNPNGGYDLYASHVFSAAGSYQISASVQTTAIPNPQFTGSNPATGTVTSSGSFTTTAQVADNNPNAPQLLQLYAPSDTFSAKLSNFFGNDTTELLWGDGAGEGGYSSDSYVDPTAVDASHTYLSPGTYTVSALDRNSNTIFFAQMNATASSSPAPSPTPSLIFPAQSVAGQHFAGYLGTINNLPLPGQADLIFGGTSANTVVLSNTTQSTTLNISINWGDGTTDNAVYLVSNGKGGYNVFGYHTYASAAEFAISVNVAGSPTPSPLNDGTFLPGPAPFNASISAAMQVAATGASSLPQLSAPNGIFNGKIASSVGDGTTTVYWGDGSTGDPTLVTPPGAYTTYSTVSTTSGTTPGTFVVPSTHPFDAYGSHNYTADGTYLLTFFSRESHTVYFAEVTVTGPISSTPAGNPILPAPSPTSPSQGTSSGSGSATTGSTTQTPTVTPKPTTPAPKAAPLKQIQLTTGKKFSGTLATFTPPNGASILLGVMTIHWGDGTTSNGTAVRQKNGTWTIQGNHTYQKVGHNTITVTWSYSPLPKKATSGAFSLSSTPGQTQLLAIVAAPPRPVFNYGRR